jgi:hypothetical protein
VVISPLGLSGVNNAGTIVGLLEGLQRFPELEWIVYFPDGFSETAAFRYRDGVCSLIMDDEFIALRAWYVNQSGEIAGAGAPYVFDPITSDPASLATCIVITGEVRPMVWSPRPWLSVWRDVRG